jgi:hypothetical protein
MATYVEVIEMEIRDAVPEDAPAAREVLRRSISELCHADHHDDPVILGRWLANKTTEIVASWIVQRGNSVLVVAAGVPFQWTTALDCGTLPLLGLLGDAIMADSTRS